jgi:NTP pyrophosphatase (non-canonical NTP hydrolase)
MPGQDLARMQSGVTALSQWLDTAHADWDPRANLYSRVTKVCEEAGEVAEEIDVLVLARIAVLISRAQGRVHSVLGSAIGENPRKGTTETMEAVVKELLDVVLTALGAIEHIRGNRGVALVELADHIETRLARVGLVLDTP